MSIKQELKALRGDSELLQAETVVDWAAKHPRSELHKSFEWDDKKCGREYRLWQARTLIRIHIIDEVGVPQMVSLTIDRVKEGGGYREERSVMADKKLRQVMLQDALDELDRVRAKYERVVELAKVWAAIDEVKKETKGGGRDKKAA
jgi:hypothetical protein